MLYYLIFSTHNYIDNQYKITDFYTHIFIHKKVIEQQAQLCKCDYSQNR